MRREDATHGYIQAFAALPTDEEERHEKMIAEFGHGLCIAEICS